MLITIWVVKGGVSDGIEKANRVLMPGLFILFIALAIRSLTLPGAMDGVAFLLKPDWSYLKPGTMLTALGQAFFALSIGVSAMITYASYLGKDQDMFRSGHMIMWMNLFVSLLAGLVIFPAVFAFGFEPGQGPGLIFCCVACGLHENADGYIFVCRVYAVGCLCNADFCVFHAGNRYCGNHPPRREKTQQPRLGNRHCDFHSRYPFSTVFRRMERV